MHIKIVFNGSSKNVLFTKKEALLYFGTVISWLGWEKLQCEKRKMNCITRISIH